MLVVLQFVFLLFFSRASSQTVPAPAPSARPITSWRTLSGNAPIAIANGGNSGLFPDQTFLAYADALNKSTPGTVQYCDVQLSKDGQAICRTNIDLSFSTDVSAVFKGKNSTYNVNGMKTEGYFSIDFTANELFNNITAIQTSQSRPPDFNGAPLFSPEQLASVLNTTLLGAMWLNVEYAKFYEEHKLNMTAYIQSSIVNLAPDYISSTEVGLLKALRPNAGSKTKLIFKVPIDINAVEPTTNQTYDSLLKDLKNIKSFASGFLVSKDRIWLINEDTLILESSTSLVENAHNAKLEVHAFSFANDQYPNSYNYSFDPIKEYLNFIKVSNFSVDGLLSDFPATASVAIECYAHETKASSKLAGAFLQGKQAVVTHSGGDSGNFPGSTRLAYSSAINSGADYIDCAVQITKDGVLLCREAPDLVISTNVAQTPLFQNLRSVPEIQPSAGVFTFDLTWKEISSLKAKIFSPQALSVGNMTRNPAYDNLENILTVSDFLNISNKIGTYFVLENAYYLNATAKLDIASTLVNLLNKEGFDKKTNLVIQSEDAAVLRSLKTMVPSTTALVYSVTLPTEGSVTLTDGVLEKIKEFASGVVVPKKLIAPSTNSYLNKPSDVVTLIRSHNLTLLVKFLRNEFVSLAFDYLADPTLEIDSFLGYYQVDAIVTDFPATATAYLSNRCTQTRLQAGTNGYRIPRVTPGLLLEYLNIPTPPASAPSPSLSIEEPPYTTLTPNTTPAPSPLATKSSSSSLSPTSFLLLLLLLFHILLPLLVS